MTARPFARMANPSQVTMNTDWEEAVIDQVVDYMQANMVPEVLGSMRANVPVDTGALRAGIWARARKLGKRVATLEAGSTARHFFFVEYGTGTRGRGTWKASDTGDFGPPRQYRHGPSRGNVAQPFARPALMWAIRGHFSMTIGKGGRQ